MKAVFLKSVLPQPAAVHTVPVHRRQSTSTQMEARIAAAAIPSTSSAAEIYGTPKRSPKDDDDDVDDDDVDVADGGFVLKDAQDYGRK